VHEGVGRRPDAFTCAKGSAAGRPTVRARSSAEGRHPLQPFRQGRHL